MVETVHIIDDNPDVRDSLCTLLEVKGYSVQGHSSAEAFVAVFSASDTLCIVVDLRMPGMSGLDLQSHLTSKAFDVPFIMITGYGDVPSAVKALKTGATDFIEKPVEGALLIAAVENAARIRRATIAKNNSERFAKRKITTLTAREREVLQQVVSGNPNKIIAYELGISQRTVENHRARLMDKLQVESVADLVKIALAGDVLGETLSSKTREIR
jgi:FixJ family two-component response regulator